MADTMDLSATLSGALRLTWVSDQLAHVLDHSQTDEPSGTWTGLARPGHGLQLGTDVDKASATPFRPGMRTGMADMGVVRDLCT